MELYSIIFGALLVLIVPQTVRADIPGCHFLETVNLSSSHRLQNGSYLYKDLVVPVHLTGEYDYITTEWGINNTVKRHLRGCVCQLKPCIWFCCRFKDWVTANGECTDGLMEELSAINLYLNVTLGNGSVVKRNLPEDFIVLRDRIRIDDIWVEDEFALFENGSVLLRTEAYEMDFRGYNCLHPNQFRSGNTEFFVVAFHIEYNDYPPGAEELLWLSELFLALTIAVYLYVKKLRNLTGKCFICFIFCNIYIFSFISFSNLWLKTDHVCVINAYSYFFFVMARYTWGSAMSHQQWRGLTSINRAASEYSFGVYSIFAWGTPAILTGFLYLIDQLWDGDPNKFVWISGVGWESCDFMNTQTHSLIYPFYTLQALNITLFILTAINIVKVKLSLTCSSDQGERARNLNSGIQMFKMFLRLFVVMDVPYCLFIISYFADWDLLYDLFIYFYLSTGMIIFVLYVLKRTTIRLLLERIRNGRR